MRTINKELLKEKFDKVFLKLGTPRIELRVRDVQNVLGVKSTNTAHYTLKQWERMGLVEREESGDEKGRWFVK